MQPASQQPPRVKRPYGLQKQQNKVRNVKVCFWKYSILCCLNVAQRKLLDGFCSQRLPTQTATERSDGTSELNWGRFAPSALPWLAVVCGLWKSSAYCCRKWRILYNGEPVTSWFTKPSTYSRLHIFYLIATCTCNLH